jgi:limonene-1,2-epoxide hydrolase
MPDTDSADVVDRFIAALVALDLDAALALVTDDIEYDNVPMGKVHGPEAIRQTLAPFLEGCSAIEWVVHRQTVTGDVVMNERTDRFQLGDRWMDLPVAGVFELRDGRIALWRDYFDVQTFNTQLAGE